MYPQRATQAGTQGELSGWYEICPGEPHPPQQAALPLGSFPFSHHPEGCPGAQLLTRCPPQPPATTPPMGHMLPVETCLLTAQSHRADIPQTGNLEKLLNLRTR